MCVIRFICQFEVLYHLFSSVGNQYLFFIFSSRRRTRHSLLTAVLYTIDNGSRGAACGGRRVEVGAQQRGGARCDSGTVVLAEGVEDGLAAGALELGGVRVEVEGGVAFFE